jgi:hypothetical protein
MNHEPRSCKSSLDVEPLLPSCPSVEICSRFPLRSLRAPVEGLPTLVLFGVVWCSLVLFGPKFIGSSGFRGRTCGLPSHGSFASHWPFNSYRLLTAPYRYLTGSRHAFHPMFIRVLTGLTVPDPQRVGGGPPSIRLNGACYSGWRISEQSEINRAKLKPNAPSPAVKTWDALH